jgi:hypothetical protein
MEVLEQQVGILEDYIEDHQKKIAQAAISQAKIQDYQSQIVKLRAHIAVLESRLTNKAPTEPTVRA